MSGYLVVPYTEEGYMKLGRNLGRTFLDYYKLNNLSSPRKSNKLSLEKLTLSPVVGKKGKDKNTAGKRCDNNIDVKYNGHNGGGYKGNRRNSWEGKRGEERGEGSTSSMAHLKMKHKGGSKS